MARMTREEILRRAQEDDVEFIHMQFTDIFGQMKNVSIARSQLEKALNNQIMIDGSSIEGFTRIHESDQNLWPDLDTYVKLPWRPQEASEVRLICDVHNTDGTPFIGDPRGVLKSELEKAAKMGYSFNVGPECEFFLFETDDHGHPTVNTTDAAGYFDLAPIDRGGDVRREICLTLEKMGFEIEASHHECAIGQHEIDFKYEEALKAADDIMTFKLTVKTIAQKNGMHATFMPKPIYGIAGSGMHINMSLFKDGRNIFYDENGDKQLSKEAYSFIAGILEHVEGIVAITNPLVNSYKRLVPGFEAPCYLAWSASNRSALVRIPAARGQSTRVELRCPDPSCNPYLALAVCLAAGLDGIRKKTEPGEPVEGNIFEMSASEREAGGIRTLPMSLGESLEALIRDDLIKGVLGSDLAEKYIEARKAEFSDYLAHVSQWEVDEYLYKI